MKYVVTMPSLGADMDAGKLVEWLVKPGDSVKKGDAIAVIETQKSTVEIESFRDGQMASLVANEGDVINVGSPIAEMDIPAEVETKSTLDLSHAEEIPPGSKAGTRKNPPPTPRLKISPAALRLVRERGVDPQQIKGTGPEGAIELRDVEAFEGRATFINIREATARQMAKSKREIPHYYLRQRISLDAVIDWVSRENSRRKPEDRLMIPAVLLRATTLALRGSPDLNGFFLQGKYSPTKSIHLGVAIAIKDSGVMVPAILDAHTLSVSEMQKALHDLVERTRSGRLKNREMTDGTFTVTNVGDLGAHEVYGVIFPPQVAILGFGRIFKAPVVYGSEVRPGFVINASLSADHRVSDGISGSRFLIKLEHLLQKPEDLEVNHGPNEGD